jgi:hypothetical protein
MVLALFKFLIINVKKFKTKILGVHKMCVYMPCNFYNQIQNTLREK